MGGKVVGILDGADRRNLRIVYDDEWSKNEASTPLSVSLPLTGREHSGQKVANYLWGLLPDNDRVLARWAAAYQCSATDVFGLLRGVGSDVAGAARYLRPDERADESVEGAIDELGEADVAALLREVRSDTSAWNVRGRGHWSLAGAQAKIALAYDEERRIWGLPSGARATTHILKPAVAGLTDHDLNEHLCLCAAGSLGLRVAETRIQSFGAERALVVTRYDRARRNGAVMRVHQEDCCQALGIHPERKYQAEGGPSLQDIARLLREVELTPADADVDMLLRALAFNWLVLGTDAHAKNFSILLSGRQVRLAPLYDVASAATYGVHPKKLRMAQKIGGEYCPASVGARDWERLAIAARVDPERLLAAIRDMAARLPDAIATALESMAPTAEERVAAGRLLGALVPWIERCLASVAG